MILIVSHADDVHATCVLRTLSARGADAVLFDVASFPLNTSIDVAAGDHSSRYIDITVETDGGTYDFGEVRAAWWRRPRQFGMDPDMRSEEDRQFAYNECYSAVWGMWLCLEPFWVNHPMQEEAASRKVYQLKAARQAGLRIPETCITNSPERAAAFASAQGGRTVYKAFSATESAWRETRLLRPEELPLLEQVRNAPVIFQRYIEAGYDLRITIIGDRIFPARILSQEQDYKVDFRIHINDVKIEPCTLPAGVEAGLRSLMDRLGLVYGAIDMRLTPEGEYVFLEINPTGQWLFIEAATGQPIAAAFADLLIRHDLKP
jgi:hypothetical protein